MAWRCGGATHDEAGMSALLSPDRNKSLGTLVSPRSAFTPRSSVCSEEANSTPSTPRTAFSKAPSSRKPSSSSK